jgi:hypothetical protein
MAAPCPCMLASRNGARRGTPSKATPHDLPGGRRRHPPSPSRRLQHCRPSRSRTGISPSPTRQGRSVRTEQGPYLDEAHRATSVVAVVAGAVKRTVLEHLPVPGITAKEPVEFGIAVDEVQPQPEGGSYYFMAARLAHQTGSGSNQIPLGGKAGVKYPQTVAQEQLREWRRGRSSCHLAMSRIRCAWSPPNCAQSLRTSTSWTSNNSPSSTLAVR